MCGLVGVFSKRGKRAGNMVIETYRKQQSRGRAGFGYIGIRNGKIVSIERSKEEGDIIKKLNKEEASFILFHHRLPTSTENTLGTTHPIVVSNPELKYDYYVAHNGVIGNSHSLKQAHNKLGYKYTTEHTKDTVVRYLDGTIEHSDTGAVVRFNDTESLAIELARYIEGLTDKVGITGSAAFWIVQKEKESNDIVNIFYGKNYGRDLKEIDSGKWWGFSSQTGTDLAEMILYKLNFEKWEIEELKLDIDEAKPVGQTTRYGVNAGFTNPSYQKQQDYKDWVGGRNAYDNLENKYYTWGEMVDTGFPTSEFFKTNVGGRQLWLPMKYAGKTDDRKPLEQLALPVPTPYQPEVADNLEDKVRDKLEELCMEYAEIETRMEELLNLPDEDEESNKEYAELRLRSEAIEDEVAALGVTEQLAEESLEVARDIVLNYT